jgi:hypothetical protein
MKTDVQKFKNIFLYLLLFCTVQLINAKEYNVTKAFQVFEIYCIKYFSASYYTLQYLDQI